MDSRKIGILVNHNNTNVGSILYSYTLWKSVKNVFPNEEVEIIDYRTLGWEIGRLFSLNPNRLIKKLANDLNSIDFFKNIDALTPEKIITNNYKKAINFLEKQNYDLIIVGSDALRHVRPKKGLKKIISRPFPNAYYLHPKLNCFKATYAISMHGTDLKSLSDSRKDKVQHLLSAFDIISVRDKHTKEFMNELNICDPPILTDPTLLCEIPSPEMAKRLEEKGINLD